MKLPRLSPDEVHALQLDGRDAAWSLAERIKVHLSAGLPAHIRVETGVLALPVCVTTGEAPRLCADDDLLVAWVAARFGSGAVCQPVPARYSTSLLTRIAQALAEIVLRGQCDEAATLHLEVRLNDRCGRLELDWNDMNAEALRAWACKQWESMNG